MVAFLHEDFEANPKTLCEWVKNFRLKKMQMKRKLRGGNLRINAILSMALVSAEHELRRKQHERFNRWLALQSQMESKVCSSERGLSRVRLSEDDESQLAYERLQQNEAFPLSKDEQSSAGLVAAEQPNPFKCNENSESSTLLSCASECLRREAEISNLWKCELSGLDEFMRSISSSSGHSSAEQQQATAVCS